VQIHFTEKQIVVFFSDEDPENLGEVVMIGRGGFVPLAEENARNQEILH
jgi:hypothetical protein